MKTLHTVLAAVALSVVATSAFADPPKATGPLGTGNFRRAEVVQAAGVKAENARVTGVAVATQREAPASVPKNLRVMAVETLRGQGKGNVTYVKAPVDKDQPVSKLSDTAAHKMGLVTQKDAEKAAERNGGIAGSPGKVDVKRDGLTLTGRSFEFKQTSPSTLTIKRDGEKQQVSNIERTVTLTGQGESASFASKTIQPAPQK